MESTGPKLDNTDLKGRIEHLRDRISRLELALEVLESQWISRIKPLVVDYNKRFGYGMKTRTCPKCQNITGATKTAEGNPNNICPVCGADLRPISADEKLR